MQTRRVQGLKPLKDLQSIRDLEDAILIEIRDGWGPLRDRDRLGEPLYRQEGLLYVEDRRIVLRAA